MRARPGFTLIELIVVVVLLGTIASLVGLAIPEPVSTDDSVAARLFAGREESLRTGRPVTVWLGTVGSAQSAIAMPDGSIVADTGAHVDRFTGRLHSAPMRPR